MIFFFLLLLLFFFFLGSLDTRVTTCKRKIQSNKLLLNKYIELDFKKRKILKEKKLKKIKSKSKSNLALQQYEVNLKKFKDNFFSLL